MAIEFLPRGQAGRLPRPPPGWKVVIVTCELTDGAWIPVVRHELYGETEERALEVLDAHMKSDAFLRQCSTTGLFEGRVICKSIGVVQPI